MSAQETNSQDIGQDKPFAEPIEDANQPEGREVSKKPDRYNGKDKDGNTVGWEW